MAENKQHTPEFENCIEEVMKQGHEKGSAFAICTTTFQKAGKPVFVGETETQKLHLFSENIRIEGNKVSGVAIHPKKIFHPEEGLTHVYLREELEKAAFTLVGKPFGIDHIYILPPPNVITKAWYDAEEDGVAFEGVVDDNIAEQIRNKAFKGLSIELNWLKPGGKVEYVNGVAARNFELTSVHLLRNFPPGDKNAYIRLWNSVKEQLIAGPPLPLDQHACMHENSCLITIKNRPCMGPVINAGCGALCPTVNRDCEGCYGPMSSPNASALAETFRKIGLPGDDIVRKFRKYAGTTPDFRREAEGE